MAGTIRVGIVGCGHIAAAHLNALKELKEKGLLEDVVVAGLCNRTQWKAESFLRRGEGPEQQPGVGPPGDPMQAPPVWVSDFQDGPQPRVYTDYREMFASEELNAVLVLSSVFTHHEIAMAAVRAGMHVLVEKPFTVTVKAGRRLVEAARKRGVVLGVAECVRYMPAVRMARWAFEQGYLGELQMSAYASAGGYWAPASIVAGTAWRHRKREAAGGVSVDWMVHFFDQLRYVAGEIEEVSSLASVVEPVRVSRDGDGTLTERVECQTDDTMSCSFRYAGGAHGTIFVSWAGHGAASDLPPVFYGTKGCLKAGQMILDGREPEALAEVFAREADQATRERFFPRGITNLFTLENLDFLEAIRRGGSMEASGEEGVRDLAACFAVLESSLLGRRVKVQEILSGRSSAYERQINRHYGL